MISPRTEDAIELAWWERGRARDVALRLCVRLSWLEDHWSALRKQGKLPTWHRPAGGFDHTREQATLARLYWQLCMSAPFGGDDIARAIIAPKAVRAA